MKRLSKESAIWGIVGKSVKGGVGVEVRRVKNVRQNRVSPDKNKPGNYCTIARVYISKRQPDNS